jgi:hypothetical protein
MIIVVEQSLKRVVDRINLLESNIKKKLLLTAPEAEFCR